MRVSEIEHLRLRTAKATTGEEALALLPDVIRLINHVSRKKAAPKLEATSQALASAVCHVFNVRHDNLTGKRTRDCYVEARRGYIYVAYTQLAKTVSEIGRELGNRDHSTICHALNGDKFTHGAFALYLNDSDFRDKVDQVIKILENTKR